VLRRDAARETVLWDSALEQRRRQQREKEEFEQVSIKLSAPLKEMACGAVLANGAQANLATSLSSSSFSMIWLLLGKVTNVTYSRDQKYLPLYNWDLGSEDVEVDCTAL